MKWILLDIWKKRSILSLSNTQFCCKVYTGSQKNTSHFQMKIWGFPPNPLAPSPSLLTHKMIVRQIEDRVGRAHGMCQCTLPQKVRRVQHNVHCACFHHEFPPYPCVLLNTLWTTIRLDHNENVVSATMFDTTIKWYLEWCKLFFDALISLYFLEYLSLYFFIITLLENAQIH